MLNVNHHAQPLDAYEGNKIVLAVHHYFAEHYPDPIAIPEVSHNLGISLVHIEAAFDTGSIDSVTRCTEIHLRTSQRRSTTVAWAPG